MARFACKSSSTLSHRLSVINLAIQRNSKKEQEETRRLRITHRVSLVSKTTKRGAVALILLAISSLGFVVGLALLGWALGWLQFNQMPRLNQRLNHRSSIGARLDFSLVGNDDCGNECEKGNRDNAGLAITGRLDGGRQPDILVRTARILPSSPASTTMTYDDEKEANFEYSLIIREGFADLL